MTTEDEVFLWFFDWVYSRYMQNRMGCKSCVINTISNPGWGMTVELNPPDRSAVVGPLEDIENSERDWHYCVIKGDCFEADGGPFNLFDLLNNFRKLVAKNREKTSPELKDISAEPLVWLTKWYHNHCNGDWEHGNGIRIGTLDNPGWYLSVSLRDTVCEGKDFKTIKIERSENDWLHCFVQDQRFEGPCGPFNLSEVLEIFQKWAQDCAEEA